MKHFPQGCRVRVLDEDARGEVMESTPLAVCVLLDETGFAETYKPEELVLDEEFNVGKTNPKENIKPISPRHKPDAIQELEFDLHFGQLVDYPNRYQANERLPIQLQAAKEKIEECRRLKVQKLILVHGKGEGILRQKIHEYLRKQSKIEFFDANWRRFKGGATEVRFY